MTITMKQECNEMAGCGAATAWGADAFFTKAHFQLLEELMYPKKAKAGEYLFWEGDATGKLYYVRSGSVKVTKTTEDGKTVNLTIQRRGDLLGELGMTGSDMYDYSAVLLEDGEFGVIQEKDLEILLHRHGDFAVAFTKWMALQHRTTQSKFRDLLLFGKPGALASTLIRLCNTCGVVTKDGIRLTIKLTNTELAEFIGATRESVNRMLSDLKADDIIEIEGGCITVKSLNRLKAICQCPSFPACPREICRI